MNVFERLEKEQKEREQKERGVPETQQAPETQVWEDTPTNLMSFDMDPYREKSGASSELAEVFNLHGTKQGRELLADRHGGKAGDFRRRSREGYIESTFNMLILDKILGLDYDAYGEKTLEDIEEKGALDIVDTRQLMASNREMHDLFVEHARQQLGDSAAEAVSETFGLTGYQLGEQGLVDKVINNWQKLVDSTIPFYLATGMRRRIFEDTHYEMPQDFRFQSSLEDNLQVVLDEVRKTGEPMKVGAMHGFMSDTEITPDMDIEAAREVTWNNQLAFLRNNIASQVQSGTAEDISMLITTLASFGTGAVVSGSMRAAGATGRVANVTSRALRAVDMAGSAPTIMGAASLAAKLGKNTRYIQTANRMGNAMKAAVPLRLRPMTDLAGRTLNLSTSFAIMGAVSNKGEEALGAKMGAVSGAMLPLAFGGMGALRNTVKPGNAYINWGNPQQADLARNINQRVSRELANAPSELGSQDTRAFNYAVREAVKDPEVIKQLEDLHNLLNPHTTVQGKLNLRALDEISAGIGRRIDEMNAAGTRAAVREAAELQTFHKRIKAVRSTLAKSANSPDFLKIAEGISPDIAKPLKRQLQEAAFAKETYLTRYLSEVLSSPFASGGVNIQAATTNNFGDLGVSDQLFKNLRNVMNPHGLVGVDAATEAVRLQYRRVTELADGLRTDLKTLGVSPTKADTIAKSVREGSLDVNLNELGLSREARVAMTDSIRNINEQVGECRAAQSKLATAVQEVQGVIGDRGIVSKTATKATAGLETGLLMNEKTLARVASELKKHGGKKVENLLEEFLTFRKSLGSGGLKTLDLSSLGDSGDRGILDTRKALNSLGNLKHQDNLELQMGRDVLISYLKNRRVFLKEVGQVQEVLNTIGTQTRASTRVRTLQRVQAEVSTPYLKSLLNAEQQNLRSSLISEVSTNMGLTGQHAEYVANWSLGDGFAVMQQIVSREGGDRSDLLVNQFTELTHVYGKLSSDILETIVSKYRDETGGNVNKAFLHGMFLRSNDPQAVSRAFGGSMQEYAREAAKGAAKFRRDSGDIDKLAGRLTHSISQEYLAEEGTGISAGVAMGRFQQEANNAMNRVGAFFNEKTNKEMVDNIRTILGNHSYHDQYRIQDTLKLLDGVAGVNTLMYSCDIDGNFTRTASGELINRIVKAGGLQDSNAANNAVREALKEPRLVKELMEQFEREGGNFRIEQLTEGQLDESYRKFARDFVRYTQTYFAPIRNASTDIFEVSEQLYANVRKLDSAISRQSAADAGVQARRWGYQIDPIQHRANRPVGQTQEQSIGVLSDMKMQAAGASHDRVTMLGRRFGTSDKMQLIKAAQRTLGDTVDLTNNVVFDATRRIQDINIAHARGELTKHIERLDGLGFTAYARMFRDFRDLDLTLNHTANVADSVFRALTKTDRASSMMRRSISKTTTLTLDTLDAFFSPFAILGRLTKPFKEAFQALYTVTMASPSSYGTLLGWKNAVTLIGSAFTNSFRAAHAATVGLATRANISDLLPSSGGSPLHQRLGVLSNELIEEAYTQSSKFVGARKLMRTAQAQSTRLGGIAGSIEEGLQGVYRGTADVFLYTKEMQEAFSSRTGTRIAENFLLDLEVMHRNGASVVELANRMRKHYKGSVSHVQLMDTVTKLFKGVEPGKLTEHLNTSQGAMAYKTFAGLVHDTTIGRFGASAGGGLSRVASRLAPGLGMYSVPKSQFLDRLIVKPLVATAYGTGNVMTDTLIPTIIGGCTYLLYRGLFIEVMESGTDSLGSTDAFGERDWVGRAADAYGSIVEGVLGELSQDPQYQAFVNRTVRTGTGIPLSVGGIEPRTLWTVLQGESDTGTLIDTAVADILGVGGAERGVGNILGVGGVSAFARAAPSLLKAPKLGIYGGKIEKDLNALHDLAGQTWESPEAYHEAIKTVVGRMVEHLPRMRRETIQNKILENGGMVSAELQEELILASQEMWFQEITSIGLNTPLAPAFHLFNPSVMAAAYKEFIADPDGLESVEEWEDLRKHFGIHPTGEIPKAEEFAARMYRSFRNAGVISQALYEKKMRDFEEYWHHQFIPQVHPDLQTYYRGER